MRGRVRQKAVPIVPALATNGFVLFAAAVAGSVQFVKVLLIDFGRSFSFFIDDTAEGRALDARLRDCEILCGTGGVVLWAAAITALFTGLVSLDRVRTALVLQSVVLLLCAAGAALDIAFYVEFVKRPRTWWWLVDAVSVAVAFGVAMAGVGRELSRLSRRRPRPSPG